MNRTGRLPLFAAILVAAAASVAETGLVELRPPREPTAGEALYLQVTVGSLPRGARLVALTAEGRVLGGVFPFGAPQAMMINSIPVPADAVSNSRLRLRLQVLEPGAPPRPPRPGEVERLDLILVPGGE